MILAIEEVRSQARGRRSAMNRLRPSIKKKGERAALEASALHESDGFQEVLDYGLDPDVLSQRAMVV
ncbi:MAG: hypothetical protein WA948_07505 [Pontixanthobacter sp.]